MPSRAFILTQPEESHYQIKRALFDGVDLVPCAHCGEPLSRAAATLDHMVPRSWGGPKLLTNIAAACHACNRHRGALGFWSFRASMAPVRALRRLGLPMPTRGDEATFVALVKATLALRVAVRALSGRESVPEAIATIWRLDRSFLGHCFVATGAEREAEAVEIAALERERAA